MRPEVPKALIIVGDGEFAEIAYEYFTHDSPYEVVAFCVEKDYLKKKTLFGLPVVPFEELEWQYDPTSHSVFVAVTFTQLNRVRARLYEEVKKKEFSVCSYVSSKAFVWRNVKIGENCFIFENNVVQHHVSLGNNVVMWSGNFVGHRTRIEDNVFLSSHVTVSGYSVIEANCFLGMNSTIASDDIADPRTIARDCVIGAGAVVVKNTEAGKVYVGNPARPTQRNSYHACGVEENNGLAK